MEYDRYAKMDTDKLRVELRRADRLIDVVRAEIRGVTGCSKTLRQAYGQYERIVNDTKKSSGTVEEKSGPTSSDSEKVSVALDKVPAESVSEGKRSSAPSQ